MRVSWLVQLPLMEKFRRIKSNRYKLLPKIFPIHLSEGMQSLLFRLELNEYTKLFSH